MIDIKINPDSDTRIAYITASDLKIGYDAIYLGGDTEDLNGRVKSGCTQFDLAFSHHERPVESMYESYLPYAIIHESTHIAIYKLEGERATRALDRVDNVYKQILNPPDFRVVIE